MEKWLDNHIFAGLDRPALAGLVERHPPTTYEPNALIFEAGAPSDHLYVLLAGTVRVFHRGNDGRESVVKLLSAPAVFGDVEVISEVCFLESVSSLDQTSIARIPADVYRSLLCEHPRAMWAQLRHASAKFCVAIHNERQCFGTLEERVANILLSYCEVFGKKQGRAIVIEHPLSQVDIARSLAVVQRSVANVFARWGRSGVIGKRGSYFLVRRPELLEQLAAPLRHGIAYRMGLPLGRLVPREDDVRAILALADQQVEIGAELILGARPPAAFIVADPAVSEVHCRVFRGPTGQRYWVADLESRTGTWVNDRRVRRAMLRDGDIIVVGSSRLCFSLVKNVTA